MMWVMPPRSKPGKSAEHLFPAGNPMKCYVFEVCEIMSGKRKSAGIIASSRKKRRTTHAIEEISFDTGSREDYLTGFHKRKLQRIKHAREESAKKGREDKIAARKAVGNGEHIRSMARWLIFA